MKIPLPKLPSQQALSVDLQFIQPQNLPLYHEPVIQNALKALTRQLLPSNTSTPFTLICPESARTHYPANTSYYFCIISLSIDSIQPLWQQLIIKLRQLPIESTPFIKNCTLISLRNLLDGTPVSNAQSLTQYTFDLALSQATDWRNTQTTTLNWRWISPAHTPIGNTLCRDKTELSAKHLCEQIAHSLYDLIQHNNSTETNHLFHLWTQSQYKHIAIHKADLYWIDTPYHPNQTNFSGISGNFTFSLSEEAPTKLLALIIYAQNIGIGLNYQKGFGKYRLSSPNDTYFSTLSNHCMPITRCESLLKHFTHPQMIERAIAELEQKPNIDKLSDKTHAQIQSAIGQVRKQDYTPPNLFGFTTPKKDGTDRLLAVAPLYDRILQKACAIALTPTLEAIMSQASFGYRKGLSRQQVRYAIQQYYRQGYKWVLESDIDDFFDSINRTLLINRLASFFGPDPLWNLMEQWLNRPIIYQGHTIQRPDGIPQGSPLSPLLANFILDDFDSDLEAYGFKLIRFADDFVILCRSKSEAIEARSAVTKHLKEINLKLNPEKTHISEIDHGFRFLGYLFHEEAAIDISGTTQDGSNSYSADNAPPNLPNWLLTLSQKTIAPVTTDDKPQHHLGNIEQSGTHIILAGDAQTLSTDNNNLIVKKDKTITYNIPWEQIHAITLIGLHHITIPAQHTALEKRIPIYLARRNGVYLGQLTSNLPAQNSYKNWFTQIQAFDNASFALHSARNIVEARIHNQMQLLIKRKTQTAAIKTIRHKLTAHKKKTQSATSLQSLNGIEGSATKQYFNALKTLLPEWAQFKTRTRRPPTDPFNALLSLGYTILYTHIDSILHTAGLLTFKGIYHQQSPNHSALASDLMESYRHIIESACLHIIRQGAIKQEDFTHDPQKGTRLQAQARRRFVYTILQRIEKFSKEQTLHQHIYSQAQLLKQAIDKQQPFKPYKTK